MERTFGEIYGILEGDIFKNRIELSHSKVHKPIQAGISGSENEGADSIVISGGYEDDEDYQHTIIYTGHGGRSNNSKIQVTDQTLTRGNKALAISCEKGFPVRVTRGLRTIINNTDIFVYRYDGLYRVDEYWKEKGKSGFIIWRFRLTKIIDEIDVDYIPVLEEPKPIYGKSQRRKVLIQRIVRDTYVSQQVKNLYGYKCQICDAVLETQTGFYAEAAHIRALGKPHNGPDIIENILCLCPNHHVMFDYGMISISNDFQILGLKNTVLSIHKNHNINVDFIKYHREHFYKETL
ncbi:YDG/SRA domain-containing protein [Pedobacter sp.]|uniref:YDG/SRA domain-containing protein n=1 Tax=Pedobacter sp. TaxID=1411316 RepID=UPI0031D80F71